MAVCRQNGIAVTKYEEGQILIFRLTFSLLFSNIKKQPYAGGLLSIKNDVKGLPAYRFNG